MRPNQFMTSCRSPLSQTLVAAEYELAYQQPAVFGPEIVKAMAEAFDFAWKAMVTSRHPCTIGSLQDETRRQLAHAIVESARCGKSSRSRLSEGAL